MPLTRTAKSTTRDGATVRTLLEEAAALLTSSGVTFGHGTENAVDEAAELVFFALGLRHEDAPAAYRRRVTTAQRQTALDLVARRIGERIPAAYLTHRMWFAGLEFYVDQRVLVPRSPIAELIESRFAPWLRPDHVRRVLDIGTGSGCIAIACALALPTAQVDAADVSPAALEVARINIDRYHLADRVHPRCTDVYEGLAAGRYDLIVSNPPYVSSREMARLPAEYRHEPAVGLEAGEHGLDVVRRILTGAPDRLERDGILVVEVGESETAVVEAFPQLPFTWLEFERGGGGVFLLTADELIRRPGSSVV